MHWLVEGLFRPTSNRHHVGGKTHKALLYITSAPTSLVVGYLVYSRFGVVGAVVGFLLTFFATLAIDRVIDYVMWHGMYKKMGFSKYYAKRMSEKEFLEQTKREVNIKK